MKKRFCVFIIAGAVFLGVFCAGLLLRKDILEDVAFSRTYMDRNGNLMRIFLTPDEKFRMYSDITVYPPEFISAVLLQEDKYFYVHAGVNPVSLVRAFWQTYVEKDRKIGASTITMQLAKLRYGIYTRSVPGKINQIVHALYLELFYSKEEILEAYLNIAPCGGNIEGFQAASFYYFGTDIQSLTLSQMLMLCVIPQNPSERSPSAGNIPQKLLDARAALFSSWVLEHPGDSSLKAEFNMEINAVCRFPFRAPHYADYLNTFGPPEKNKSRNIVRTSIDLKLQTICERNMGRRLEQLKSRGVHNASMLLVDYTTMEVLASVGSADFFDDDIEGQVDGTTALRSPGSALKPFVYALALEQGLIHSETVLKDTKISFNEYAPDNFGNQFRGPVKAWRALTDSRNIPAVYLAQRIKNPDLYDFLAGAGITHLKDKEEYGLSIVLGSADIRMTELACLYAAIANQGIYRPLQFIFGDVSGAAVSGKRILTGESSFIIRKMLERNPPPGILMPAEIKKIPIAYKTGTSVGFKDGWSAAIFDRYVLCVWIGNFNGEGNAAFQGRAAAAPLVFETAYAVMSEKRSSGLLPPVPPAGVSLVSVCGVSGGIPNGNCPSVTDSWFIPGVSPITPCTIHRKIYVDIRTGYRTDENAGVYVKEVVREFWSSDLLELFEQAGLPRLVPPPYPPSDAAFPRFLQGSPPEIISPTRNTRYILPSGGHDKGIVLSAAADAAATSLFWFADSVFLGRCCPSEKLLWKPSAGSYSVSVVDDIGRSDTVTVILTGE